MAQRSPGSADAAIATRRFRVCGMVQGVGFRPFVHKLAEASGAHGWVLNDSSGVLIELQATQSAIDGLIADLLARPPPLARIVDLREVPGDASAPRYDRFDIRETVGHAATDTLVPPDSAVCADCLADLNDPANRRHRYAFTNCTNCGPRYSIILGMPYDRAQTTMRGFTMCPACAHEYHDIADRRYHAQPNACPACGPSLQFTDVAGTPIATADVARRAAAELRGGVICAVKGLGGFHLAVDATNPAAIRELRRRKRRDSKPFAIMVADAAAAARFAEVSAAEAALLASIQRPIVLLRKRAGTLPDEIAPRNPNIGIMLPSTPLHVLLLQDSGLPALVMTSGNVSGQPIAYENATALAQLKDIADCFVLNDRDIHTRVDDSVVRLIARPGGGPPLMTFLRRSRGYAPYPVHLPWTVGAIVALGAELKNTVAIGKADQVFVSQHIGDLKNDSTFRTQQDCVVHMQELLAVHADTLACDLHPGFRSTRAAMAQSGLRVVQVQHHHAHMVSCMAENGLAGRAIGVVFDGAGYGSDGTIWGGEFLLGDSEAFARAGRLRPLLLLGGDKAVREPIRTAIALLVETFGDEVGEIDLPALRALPDQRRDVFTKMAANRINAVPTSSMGRLFDGIAALLGLCPEIEYEAQAAIEMEALLQGNMCTALPLDFALAAHDGLLEVDYRPTVRDLVRRLREPGVDIADLSRRFHSTVVVIIAEVCAQLVAQSGLDRIVLSGGVFCNAFVLVNALDRLAACGCKAYCHQLVPAGDGGIALGQLVVAAAPR